MTPLLTPRRISSSAAPAAEKHRLPKPMFLADWQHVVFIHFRCERALLQAQVPFELDLYRGDAYLSLVAFTQRRLRPCALGAVGAALCTPLACHEFLNVRTYVRHGDEAGIYFLAEWIPNRLAALIGPPLYGLPYRVGRPCYSQDEDVGTFHRRVSARGLELSFSGSFDQQSYSPCEPGGLDEFLLERYTAFTRDGRASRRFHIAHKSWPQTRAHVTLDSASLLEPMRILPQAAEPLSSNYSPGVRDVEIGPPERLRSVSPSHPSTRVLPKHVPPKHLSTKYWLDWLPLVVLPAASLAMRNRLSETALMLVTALGLYAGCKWLTWRRAVRQMHAVNPHRSLAYLLAWPGMDADAFLDGERRAAAPSPASWLAATAHATAGIALLWGAAPVVHSPLAAGWIGLVGLLLLLHFGVFHLLALLWRSLGVEAMPLMRSPLRARSLGEFWGSRWNTGFHHLANELLFRPLSRRLPASIALCLAFLASGLIHELVISVPARTGYGLPTAYFLVQALGMSFERSRRVRHTMLRHSSAGRVVTLAFVLGPGFFLFHPPFILRVLVPLLRMIGAAGGAS